MSPTNETANAPQRVRQGSQSIFVAGTDTGVGKTLVAAALIQSLNRQGTAVAGMKPVASGARSIDGKLRNDDALALMAHSNVVSPYETVNPYCFEPAIAPHLAAAEVGVRIDMKVLREAHARLAERAEIVVVEGAGGWLTPIDESQTLADFARSIRARVLLVVGLRLGCINHALLTARAIESAGLELMGWVANSIDAQMVRRDENIAALEARLSARRWATLPHRATMTSNEAAAMLARETCA